VAEPVFDDLEEGQPVLSVEGHEPEVIEDKQRRPGDAPDESLVSSRRSLLLERLEELRAVEIGGAVPEAAGLGAEGLGEIALPDARGAGDHDVLACGDPRAVRQTHEGVAVKPALDGEIDLGKGRAGPEAGGLREPARLAVVAVVPLGVGDMRDELVGAENSVLGGLEDAPESPFHAIELEKPQLLEGGGVVHRRLLPGAYLYAAWPRMFSWNGRSFWFSSSLAFKRSRPFSRMLFTAR